MTDLVLKVLLMVFTTFTFVALIIPFVIKLAFRIGAVDVPRERHIHSKEMPKLGGLAIFFGFLLGYMFFGTPNIQIISILIGGFIILLMGIVDDITELSSKTQFLFQIIAACIVVFYGQIVLTDVSAFGIYLEFGILSYPITILFIVGCINCLNLIDGLDGLSGGISSIYFLTMGIIAFLQGRAGLDFYLCFIMLGSTLGFLLHNFHPAKIFAGNSGSMFLGFIIACIALLGFKNVTITSLVIPLLVLAIPILDTLFAIIRRIINGENITKADKFHIHHQFLNRHFTQTQTVLIIYFIDALFASASIIYITKYKNLGYIIYGVLLVIVILFVLKTEIIIDNTKRAKIFKHKKK